MWSKTGILTLDLQNCSWSEGVGLYTHHSGWDATDVSPGSQLDEERFKS